MLKHLKHKRAPADTAWRITPELRFKLTLIYGIVLVAVVALIITQCTP